MQRPPCSSISSAWAPTNDEPGGGTRLPSLWRLLSSPCSRRPWRWVLRPEVTSGGSITDQPASSLTSPGSSNSSSSGSSSQSTLAFSQLHARPRRVAVPRPGDRGEFPSPQDLGVSNTVYQAAMNTCKHLLPNGGQPTQVESPQLLNEVLKFARCMRSHGFPSWPDPTPTPSGPRPYTFNLQGVRGFDPRSPHVDAALNECQRLTGLGVTGPPPFGLQRPN